MENNYVLIKNDGQGVKITGTVDLADLQAKLNDNQVFAVRVGNKSLQRNLIAAVATESSITKSQHNICVTVMNTNLFAQVEDTDQAISDITDAVNTQPYVLVGDILFNRNNFSSAEVV